MRCTDSFSDFVPPICRNAGKELTAETAWNHELRVDKRLADRLANILSSEGHNNAIITGKAGTGKTALVEAMSMQIASGRYPALEGRRVFAVDIDALLGRCYTVAEQGTRLGNLFKEADMYNLILFIDEGHRLCGRGDSNSLGNIAKPYLTHSGVQVILATTKEEYRRFIECDPAFRRRFEEIAIAEPTDGETVKILETVAARRYPHIQLGEKPISAMVKLSGTHSFERYNPDRSLAAMDYAIAWWKNNRTGCSAVTEDDVYASMAERYGVSESDLKTDVVAMVGEMPEKLLKRFPSWPGQISSLSRRLEAIGARKLNSAGALCSVMLAGFDKKLLTDVASAAASLAGYSKDDILMRSVKDVISLAYIDPARYEDPFVSPVLENPHRAFIITIDGSGPSAHLEALYNKIHSMAVDGVLHDHNARTGDFSSALLFVVFTGKEVKSRKQAGFGKCEEGNAELNLPEWIKAASEQIWGDEDFGIAFGAPDNAEKLYNAVFIPKLKENTCKLGVSGECTVSDTAKSEIIKRISGSNAWSNIADIASTIAKEALFSGRVCTNIDFCNSQWNVNAAHPAKQCGCDMWQSEEMGI